MKKWLVYEFVEVFDSEEEAVPELENPEKVKKENVYEKI